MSYTRGEDEEIDADVYATLTEEIAWCDYPEFVRPSTSKDYGSGAAESDEDSVGTALEECDALMITAENYNILKNGVPDADDAHLWSLAKLCLTSKDTAQDIVHDLLATGDYPLELNEHGIVDQGLGLAMKFSSLRSILPEADVSYLWKLCLDNAVTSDEHFSAFVWKLQSSGDYPLASVSELPPAMRVEVKRQSLLRSAQNILGNVDGAFIEEKLLAQPQLCFEEQGVGKAIINWLDGEFCQSKAEEYYRQQTADAIENFSNSFDVDSFIQRFPNPLEYFDRTTPITTGPKYKADCLKYLRAVATNTSPTIQEWIQKQGRTLTYCHKYLFGHAVPRAVFQYGLTDECGRFISEVTFIRYRTEILTAVRARARKNNELSGPESPADMTCELCEELFPTEQMLSCTEAHIFCTHCVKNWVQQRIQDGFLDIKCLQSCSGTMPDRLLSRVLTQSDLAILLRRRQDRDVGAAELDGIENCLWCGFRYVPPLEEKNMVCLNPECGEKWCRDCHQLAHHPEHSCEDTEEEVKKRTYIEEKMTAAVVKVCHRCKADIIRESGCDHVSCKCGHAICYRCGEPSHTHHCTKLVPLVTAQSAGIQAKADADRLFPGVKLNHDPTKSS